MIFSLLSLTSSKRNLWTNHNQPDLLISAELGKGSMIADRNSCRRYKKAIRLHSLLLHSTYLSHNTEAAFSPVSHSWTAGHCESGSVRHTLKYRLTYEAWTKIHHQTHQARAVVWHVPSTYLALEGENKCFGFPYTVIHQTVLISRNIPCAITRSIAQVKKTFFFIHCPPWIGSPWRFMHVHVSMV